MTPNDIQTNIENAFRKQVQKDERVRNAYLLVHSDKLEINLNVAEGKTGDLPASIEQPLHLASVGKLFTATLISILYDQGKLDFKDPIHKYLDKEIMEGLHVLLPFGLHH
ncbi:MAG: serine hydrolase [Bacteroidales bacterium]